jgi:hypothetical protein
MPEIELHGEDREFYAEKYPAATGALGCGAYSPAIRNVGRYRCSRPVGHEGPHVAHVDPLEAVALWTDAAVH